MLRARVLEERLITMYKQGDGFFWIGGPGEEAFNVPLGLSHRRRAKGADVRLPSRCTTARVAERCSRWARSPSDSLRQMKNTATDPVQQGGRNFAGHFSKREVEHRHR